MSGFIFIRNVLFRFCTKCLVSLLYEMSGFGFCTRCRVYEMSCVRNVVCTKCRVYELSCPRIQLFESVLNSTQNGHCNEIFLAVINIRHLDQKQLTPASQK